MVEGKKVKLRNEIDDRYKWKLEKIYSSIEDWENDFKKLKEMAPETAKYSGKLKDGQELLSYLKLEEKILRLSDKLQNYAYRRSDEDTANAVFQAMADKIGAYAAELDAMLAFFGPELMDIPEDVLRDEIVNCTELKKYEFLLMSKLLLKPHTLSKEKEELLSSIADCVNAPGKIYDMLSDADMTFPFIKDEDGNDVELTNSNYLNFISSKDRSVREAAFKALYSTYAKFKNTFAATLSSSLKTFVFYAKIKNYKNSLELSLKENNIPLDVFYSTIQTVNNNLDALHRYVKIKKKLLGLDEIHMYDLYVPLVDTPDEHIEFSDAVDIVLDGLKLLGEEYLGIFKAGIENGWIDIYPNKGKRSGAYSAGVYDTMPYILLNYEHKLDDVSTLAHEMGHSIHSYYSNSQPYVYSNYSLFAAEVASTTNEVLLLSHLIEKETDKNRRLYLINEELEQIRTTVFRQVMFAEFEKITHERAENNEPLTHEDINKIYHELNVKYFGPEMIVDNEIDMEWAKIPHFYSDFYVYQYATGYAAASSFASEILKNGEPAVNSYKSFLKSGSSDYPINVLKKAGVDMTTPKPLEDTIKRFNQLLDMLEEEQL